MNRNQNIFSKIKLIDSNDLIYDNIIYHSHFLYKDYFFNYDNKNIIIKKYSNDLWKLIPLNINKKENKKIVTITSKYIKNRPLKVYSRLVLETFTKYSPRNMVCSHIDDNVENNSLKNLCWMTQKDNMILMGINYAISKNIFLEYSVCPHLYDNSFESSGQTYITINGSKFIKLHLDLYYISIDGKSIYDFKNKKFIDIKMDTRNYLFCRIGGKRYHIHKLMAISKYNFNFKSTKHKQVLHINDIKNDNHYENIIVGTHSENMKSKAENMKKYKELRNYMKSLCYSIFYPTELEKAVKSLPNNYKNKYDYISNKYKIKIE